MELIKAFAIAIAFTAPFITLFVAGRLAQPRAQRLALADVTIVDAWSAVLRGNAALAPTTPYREFARR